MDVFGAVADPVRRRIVTLLAGGPQTAGTLAAAFPEISRPAVSRHLRVLREAGLIAAEPAGRERRYRADPRPLQEIEGWLATVRGQRWEQRLDALSTEVHRTRRDRAAGPPVTDARSAG
ncbi:ArsR/SmtB family transcription factor [Actinomadura macra]|uniref:ArsR/SmtB family transcription factor n=1 Tax=Actinomadura macra TaxID=46164 RepID=UPI000833C21F|nr:metalloregulator ArsR/SmtB family transcription factor [Actinomadura macra]